MNVTPGIVAEPVNTLFTSAIADLVNTLFIGPIEMVVPSVDDRYRHKPKGNSDQGWVEDPD